MVLVSLDVKLYGIWNVITSVNIVINNRYIITDNTYENNFLLVLSIRNTYAIIIKIMVLTNNKSVLIKSYNIPYINKVI